jgi:exo-beta-1,3-glucanase (GH17 family)
MRISVNLFVSLFLAVTVISASPKIKAINYSPFWLGESPTTSSPTKAQIMADLSMLKAMTSSVRFYGIDSSYYWFIAQACESLSVNYIVSGWTSFQYPVTWSTDRNDIVRFLRHADSLGYQHLSAIMYGYDNNTDASYLTEAQKIAFVEAEIDTLRATLKKDSLAPVLITHEENWDVWTRYPELADSLDFVSIRIVPQTDLVPLDSAWQYVQSCYAAVKKSIPNKTVKITAVGWETDGSCERDQKIFLDSLTADTALDYCLCNFADDAWKASPEGSYGIYTVNRQPKLFVSSPSLLEYPNLFPRDSSRVSGIVYSYGSFGYSQYISLPAMEKDVGRWADTLQQISDFTFFNTGDLLIAGGDIANVFCQNGNSIAIADYSQQADSGIIISNRVKAAFVDVSNSFYSFAASNDEGRQSVLDNIRHNYVIPIRSRSLNDSIFVGAAINSGFFPIDSLIKYPGVLQDFDGYLITVASLTDYRFVAQKDAYIDSLIGVYAALSGKKMIVKINCSDLYYDLITNPTDYYQSKEVCSAFIKAGNKHGVLIVFMDISDFYGAGMTQPSAIYKYLLPGRFVSVIRSAELKVGTELSLLNLGGKLVVRNAARGAILSLFDLSGKKVRQIAINGGNYLFNFESEGIPSGVWLAKLESNGRQISTKMIYGKR